jgi:DNA-binding NarL/FixJ family response regulator
MHGLIQLALFDDNRLRRSALAGMLHASGRYQVQWQYGIRWQRFDLLSSAKPEGALLMLPTNASEYFNWAHLVRRKLPDCPIVACFENTDAWDDRCVERKNGFTDPDWPCDIILASRHEFAVLLRCLNRLHLTKQKKGMAALTPRELQVLRLIGTGRSFKEIAGELAISLNTTHTHAKRIRAKLHATSPSNLVQIAVRFHLKVLDGASPSLSQTL